MVNQKTKKGEKYVRRKRFEISKRRKAGAKLRTALFNTASVCHMGDNITSLITISLGSNEDLAIAHKIAASVVTILGAFSVVITSLSRDTALHITLDAMSFKVIAKTGHIIKETIRP